MDEIFITKSAEEWMKILKGAGDVVCTPVQTIRDLPNDPQVLANDYIIEYDNNSHRISKANESINHRSNLLKGCNIWWKVIDYCRKRPLLG